MGLLRPGAITQDDWEFSMGLFSKLTKAGVAKKAVDEARKPQNQQKLKDMAARKTGGKGGGQAPR